MSGLSETLQKSGILKIAAQGSLDALRSFVLENGLTWYSKNPIESEQIAANFKAFGIEPTAELLEATQRNVLLHYYEKFIGFCLSPSGFNSYLRENVNCEPAIKELQKSQEAQRGILMASCHFGAVELIVPTLSMAHIPVSAVLKFKTEELSKAARDRVAVMQSKGQFGSIGFVEIGKPGTVAALDMAAVLRRKETLLSMFDEKTEYSIKASLFGKTVWGGAGLDKIAKFSGGQLDIYCAFMIRQSTEKYELRLLRIDLDSSNFIQALYDKLQLILKDHLEQWYFVHEEIPFAN